MAHGTRLVIHQVSTDTITLHCKQPQCIIAHTPGESALWLSLRLSVSLGRLVGKREAADTDAGDTDAGRAEELGLSAHRCQMRGDLRAQGAANPRRVFLRFHTFLSFKLRLQIAYCVPGCWRRQRHPSAPLRVTQSRRPQEKGDNTSHSNSRGDAYKGTLSGERG